MNYATSKLSASSQDRFALKLTSRLSDSTSALPHDISERLRAARMQALGARQQVKLATSAQVVGNGMAATLSLGGPNSDLWRRAASFVPLLALVLGLLAIQFLGNDERARDLADIDSALLTDDLPPAAYTDPGFAQFLKSRQDH
jgi:Protein of unknown function (DUF3619)